MERNRKLTAFIAFVILGFSPIAVLGQAQPEIPIDEPWVEETRRKYDLPQVEYAPPLLTRPRISVMDAVRTALSHDPNIRLSEVSVNLQRGFAQEVSGEFDTVLTGNFSFEMARQELNSAALKGETDKRQSGREEAERNREKAEREEMLLEQILLVQQDPDAFEVDAPEFQSQIDIINTLISGEEDPIQQQRLIDARAEIIERLRVLQVQKVADARDEEAKSLDRLRKLGGIPSIDQSFGGSLDLRVFKPTRTGVNLGAFLTISGDGSNFLGKDRSTSLGGKGITDLYRSDAGVFFDVPLGRGAGWETTTARERAANIDLEASRLFLQHASAQTVLQVVLAYWDAVAAEQTVEAFQESSRLQTRLVDLTRALIQGDEMPAAELPRVQASQAGIGGTLIFAQRNLYDARVRLAQAMGIRVESDANIPEPTSSIPEPVSPDELRRLDSAGLAAAALDRRFDFAGARQLQESGGVLLRAALLDLKPVIDLSGELKYSAAGESPSIRLGLARALFDKWVGPSVKLGLAVDYPLGNNIQKGRAAQAQAGFDQRMINAENLGRVIRANVILSHQALIEAAAQARSSAEAIRYYNELVESEFEKLQLGSSTLINTILTEQRRTDATLGYISARQQYAQLLAQLRYESGTLVEVTPDGNRIDPENLSRPPAANAR
ncbi:MAG TPA: TolC family protein [Thermoanaerobaculia bacterium]